MRIDSIRIQAFRGFGKEFFIDLSKIDILLLHGPNGHGKTSFFDAVEWALTGEISRYSQEGTAERKNYRYIGNQFNQQIKPQVELTLKNSQGITLVVKREGTANDYDRTDDDRSILCLTIHLEGESITYSNIEADHFLNQYLINENWREKVSIKESLSLTHLLGQERMSQFVRGMREKDRYDSLSSMFGTYRFNQLREIARTVERDLKQKETKLIQSLDANSMELDATSRELEMLIFFHKSQFGDDVLLHENNLKPKEFLEIRNYNLKQFIGRYYTSEEEWDFSDQQWIEILKKHQDEIIAKKRNLVQLYLPKVEGTQNLLSEWLEIEPSYNTQATRVEKFIELEHLIQARQRFVWLYENQEIFYKQTQREKTVKSDLSELRKKLEVMQTRTRILLKVSRVLKDKTDIHKLTEVKEVSYLTDELKKDLEYYLKEDTELRELIRTVENDYLKYKGYDLQLKDITSIYKLAEKTRDKLILLDQNYRDLLQSILKYVGDHPQLAECPACGTFQSSLSLQEHVNNKQRELNPELAKVETELIDFQERIRIGIDCLNEAKDDLHNSTKNVLTYLEMMERSAKNLQDEINYLLKEIELGEHDLRQIQISLREFTERAISEGLSIESSKLSDDIVFKGQQIRDKIDDFITSLELMNLDSWVDHREEAKKLFLELKEKELILLNLAREIGYNLDKVDTNEIQFLLTHERENINQMLNQLSSDEHLIEQNLKLLIQSRNILEYQVLTDSIQVNQQKKKEIEKELKLTRSKLKIVKRIRNQVPNAVARLNKEVIDNLFETIRSLFVRVNSHPIFREIIYQTDERRNFNHLLLKVVAEGYKTDNLESSLEVNPSYIYSAAQVNSIALSFFLAMALQQKWSPLDFICMDDPVQSMDDLNVMALVDLIRSLATTKGHQKQFFISTHDYEFQQLMTKKFRFMRVGVMQYDGYSEDGPKIRIKLVDPQKGQVERLIKSLEATTEDACNTEQSFLFPNN
jgi:exonuclease SbcC